jgi:serine/threonine protein kinase
MLSTDDVSAAADTPNGTWLCWAPFWQFARPYRTRQCVLLALRHGEHRRGPACSALRLGTLLEQLPFELFEPWLTRMCPADEIVEQLGKGTFGRVLLCKDRKHAERLVALKAIRRVTKYVEAAKLEAAIMRDVNKRDAHNHSLCVRYYRSFEWKRHFFIATEPLGRSLYDYIQANEYNPLPLYCVQSFSDQILTAVSYLHDMKLVHTDLKPENILLVSREQLRLTNKLTCTREPHPVLAPRSTDVRVIDFGGATYDDARKSSLINTRQYRAPEVILGQGWSTASDLWSVGCILMELYTGRLLFSTHDSLEHLALMERCLGPFPSGMTRGGHAPKYFHRSTGKLRYWDSPESDSLAHVSRMRKLEFMIHPRDNVFLRFIRSLLEFDPARRAQARDALNDPFFTGVRGFKDPPMALNGQATKDGRSVSSARTMPLSTHPAGNAASASASDKPESSEDSLKADLTSTEAKFLPLVPSSDLLPSDRRSAGPPPREDMSSPSHGMDGAI